MSLARRNLFGGAITALTAPQLIDASDFRQVPDTQEVLLYPDSSVSIVVEILQRVDEGTDLDAARFHFASIAHDNDARSSEVGSVVALPARATASETPSAIVLRGTQLVPKFNAQNPDTVQILMGVYRIESKHVDLVVTFNIPTASEKDKGVVKDEAQLVLYQGEFESFIESLEIVDMGLFA